MSLQLNFNQRRVLGVMIEKAFTTPDQYPLTINAVVSGCNQKSNRSPVTSLTEGDVVHAVQELVHMGLAKLADVPRGARSNRYEHCITSKYAWSPKELAILTELMLRGPQTVGELRTRCDRMSSMPELQNVQNMLDTFQSNDPPEVVNIGRAAGQSAVRYRHNFQTDDEQPETVEALAPDREASPSREAGLLARIESLEARVQAIETRQSDV